MKKTLFDSLRDMTDKEIENVADTLWAELSRRKKNFRTIEHRALNINGITVKDFVVEYFDHYASPGDKDYNPYFSFYLKRGKKKYCIYNDFHDETAPKWWPTKNIAGYGGTTMVNAASDFVPDGFSEAMENAYEYQGTVEEAIACLKDHGFENIKDVQSEYGP